MGVLVFEWLYAVKLSRYFSVICIPFLLGFHKFYDSVPLVNASSQEKVFNPISLSLSLCKQ